MVSFASALIWENKLKSSIRINTKKLCVYFVFKVYYTFNLYAACVKKEHKPDFVSLSSLNVDI